MSITTSHAMIKTTDPSQSLRPVSSFSSLLATTPTLWPTYAADSVTDDSRLHKGLKTKRGSFEHGGCVVRRWGSIAPPSPVLKIYFRVLMCLVSIALSFRHMESSNYSRTSYIMNWVSDLLDLAWGTIFDSQARVLNQVPRSCFPM